MAFGYGYGGGEGGGNRFFENAPLCPPYPKAMSRVGTGNATYFWVIQYLKKTTYFPIEPKHFSKIKKQKDEDYFFIFVIKK